MFRKNLLFAASFAALVSASPAFAQTYTSSPYAGPLVSVGPNDPATAGVADAYANVMYDPVFHIATLADGTVITSGGMSYALGRRNTIYGGGAIAFGDMNISGSAAGAVVAGFAAEPSGRTTIDTIAIGASNRAWGNMGIALGTANQAGVTASAMGYANHAQADASIAIGAFNNNSNGPLINGVRSIALGSGNVTAGTQAIGLGNYNVASASNTIAIGTTASATAEYSSAEGYASVASAHSAIAQGVRAAATGAYSVAMGSDAASDADNAVSVGLKAKATQFSAYAFGSSAVADSSYGIALGHAARAGDSASGAYSSAIAVGLSSYAVENQAMAFGANARSTGALGAAFGPSSKVYAAHGVAIGSNAVSGVSGDAAVSRTTAVGVTALASGIRASAFGAGAQATAANAFAGGANARATNADTIAIGSGAQATGAKSISIGTGNIVTGTSSGAIGDPTVIDGSNSYSVGNNNTIAANDVFAFGNNIVNVAANSVFLGSGAAFTAASASTGGIGPYASAVVGTSTLAFAGGAPAGVVSVGDVGAERRIQNVAAGLVTATSTDAINGSQLYAGLTAVGAAGLDFTANDAAAGVVHRDLGQTLAIAGGATTAGAYSGANLKTVTDPATGAIRLQMAENPTFVSVTTGGTTMNGSGVTIAGGPSMTTAGVDAGGTVISNVAAGVNATDAVNVAQIDALRASGLKFAGDAGGIYAAPIGGTMTIVGGATTAGTYSAGNVQTSVDATTGVMEIRLADSPKFGNVIVNAGGSGKITGVAAGTLAAGSLDAVNGGQLYAIQQMASAGWGWQVDGGAMTDVAPGGAVNFTSGRNVTLAPTANGVSVSVTGAPTFDNVSIAGSAVALGPTGLNNGGNVLSGVSAGVAPTDAVNVAQMQAAAGGLTASGMNFTGNAGASIHRDLGQTLAIAGAATTAGTYSGANLKTVTDPATGAVNLQIADSPTFGATTINAGGSGKITGVTAGSTAAGSTEAVNGSQINTSLSSVASTLGGGSTYDPVTGTITAPTYNVAGGAYSNVGDALGAVDGRVTNLHTQVAGGAIGLVQQVGGSPGSGAITVGKDTGGAVVDFTGASGARVLTGVGAGAVTATSTDAINGGQLYAVQQMASAGWNVASGTVAGSNGVAAQSGSGAVAPGGTMTLNAGSNIALTRNGTGVDIAVRNDPTFSGMLTANGGLTVGAGQTVDMGGNRVRNIGAAVAGTDAVNLGQLRSTAESVATALGGGAVATPGGQITAPSYNVFGSTQASVGAAINALQTAAPLQFSNADGVATPGAPSNDVTLVGAAAGPVVIHNVAAGVAPTDAANTAQVAAVAGQVPGSWQIANGVRTNTYVLAAPVTGGAVRMTNLAPGEVSATSNDAVTGAQLHQTNTNVAALADWTAKGFAALDRDIRQNRKLSSAGIAGATAMGSIRYDDRPGKVSVGGAVGAFDGQAALAFGAGYTSENQAWRLSAGIHFSPTNRKSGVGAAASASYTFN